MNKKSFVLYYDLIYIIKKISLAERGEIFTNILDYVNEKIIPDHSNNLALDIIFSQIKMQLDRDKLLWENKAKINSINGSKGGKANATKRKRTVANGSERKRNVANQAVNGTVNVNGTVTDNVNVTIINSVVDYFNARAKNQVKKPSIETAANIIKIIQEGYTLDDFYSVINFITTSQWHIDNGKVTLTGICRPTTFAEKLERAKNAPPPEDTRIILRHHEKPEKVYVWTGDEWLVNLKKSYHGDTTKCRYVDDEVLACNI